MVSKVLLSKKLYNKENLLDKNKNIREVVILRNGYIIIQVETNNRYCTLGTYFWSNFNNLKILTFNEVVSLKNISLIFMVLCHNNFLNIINDSDIEKNLAQIVYLVQTISTTDKNIRFLLKL